MRLEASMMWAGKDRLRIAVSNLVHAELLASPGAPLLSSFLATSLNSGQVHPRLKTWKISELPRGCPDTRKRATIPKGLGC